MFSKLPWWVEVGGFWLAGLAGATNAVGLLGFTHQATSHLTGPAALLGAALVEANYGLLVRLLGIILAFVLGAAIAGTIVGNVALQLGRRYSAALLVETALLLGAMAALVQGSTAGHYLASAACGLQNGMVSSYSGTVVRTTHLTGMFTDLGTMLGVKLRGQAIQRRQALLYATIISGFILGATLGAWLFLTAKFLALLFPATGAAALATAHTAFLKSPRTASP